MCFNPLDRGVGIGGCRPAQTPSNGGGFNPLDRGVGIGGRGSHGLANSRTDRFNPLDRGVGIGGCWSGPNIRQTICFNPLDRGVGIGGLYSNSTGLRLLVSIRLIAA